MDKIDKALKKLSEKEKKVFKDILQRLKKNQTLGLNIVTLKGYEDVYRVRKGDLRILFRCTYDGDIDLLDLDRRSEDTYRRY